MKIIKHQDWLPSDNLELENNALDVVKSLSNSLVLAGPGAGKTEMLAQRASYLLETNTCKYPRKILAISFKRDASYNLNERVGRRCGDELGKRFDSHTFDSFAKQILDRFKKALPYGITINDQYEILLNDKDILDLYEKEGTNLHTYAIKKQVIKDHNQQPLISFDTSILDTRKSVWLQLLNNTPSKLSFPMIMRLADLIIKTNPKVQKYLQMTYQFVFLDEFQDTTDIQYQLFNSCFIGSSSVFTAVGDDKQRIMLWAGAKKTVFHDYMNDTGASQINLYMNYRSAPNIVNLLNYFSESLLNDNHKAIPSSKWNGDEGKCNIWFLSDTEQEKQALLTEVQKSIQEDNIDPRDICILIKQQLDVYAGEIIDYFLSYGIKTRNEDYYQDILTEGVSLFIINMLYWCLNKEDIDSKKQTFEFMSSIHLSSDSERFLKLERELYKFIKKARSKYDFNSLNSDNYKELFLEIYRLLDIKKLKAQFPQYKQEKFFKNLMIKLYKELWVLYQSTYNLKSALDTLVGVDTIPVMTIHKSKGLEYHTVIFVGLEDGAFWTYNSQSNEDNCAFFVALSRAKERVIFTFSKTRKDRYGRSRLQSFDNIRPIIDTMKSSGLVNLDNRMNP